MATIKVKFKPSTVADGEGMIYYRICHERRQRQLFSTYHVFPWEWNGRQEKAVARQSERKSTISSINEGIRSDLERLTRIVRQLEVSGIPYSVDEIADRFNRYTDTYTLFNFMGEIIGKLKKDGRVRTSETYSAALNSFKRFRKGEDLILDSLTSDLMESYESWHMNKGNCPNTVSFYMRILRAVYRRAVGAEIIEDRHPFKRVYTGIEKTVKRALPLPVIKKIKSLDLSMNPEQDYARDMFIMSFMLRGMSFIDMAFLKKTDLEHGYITYRRRKTGQRMIIEWKREMQMILDKYGENGSPYLLPIIRTEGVNERAVYRNVSYNINHNLKRIAEKIGLTVPLTLYVARHSWASAAKAKGVPVSVISEGMGHTSEATTRIYLATLDSSVVDRANSLIIECI